MIIAMGLDLHKEKCAAFAKFAGKGEPRPRQQEFLDKINKNFERFPTDYRGMTALADFVRNHEVHILVEGSTVTHDVYWMLKNLGLDVTAAHAADLYQITKSVDKTDNNDAMKLAGYMRRKLWGEIEFAECYIPEPECLLKRELCRYDMRLRSDLTALKCQIRAHMLIRGWKLTKDYQDITVKAALRELKAADIDIFRFDVAKVEYLKTLIHECERDIEYRMGNDWIFGILWSIPGFGVLTAAYASCMIDDPSRFRDGKSLAAFMGLTPKLDESADKPKNCGMSRRGDPDLRRLVCQATFVHIFHCDSFVSEKYKRLKANGKAHNEALVACANSMAQLMFAMLRDRKKFCSDAELLKKAREMADSDNIEEIMEEQELA